MDADTQKVQNQSNKRATNINRAGTVYPIVWKPRSNITLLFLFFLLLCILCLIIVFLVMCYSYSSYECRSPSSSSPSSSSFSMGTQKAQNQWNKRATHINRAGTAIQFRPKIVPLHSSPCTQCSDTVQAPNCISPPFTRCYPL